MARIAHNFLDLTGQVFGRLTVLRQGPRPRKRIVVWECLCSCGKIKAVRAQPLRDGMVRSCGCLLAETSRARMLKHDKSSTREHRAWCSAKTRCFNPRIRYYANYGGRGITMCDRWRNSFEAFLADMGTCPPGYSIERIDNNGNYEPSNCRWASQTEQANNTRASHFVEFRGERLTVAEWEHRLGWPVKRRLLLGWPVERALTEPPRPPRPRRVVTLP